MLSLNNMRILCLCVGFYQIVGALALPLAGSMAQGFTKAASMPMLDLGSVFPETLWPYAMAYVSCGLITAIAGWQYLRFWNIMPWLALAAMAITAFTTWSVMESLTTSMQQFIRDLPGNGLLYKRSFAGPGMFTIIAASASVALPWGVLAWISFRNKALIRAGETLEA